MYKEEQRIRELLAEMYKKVRESPPTSVNVRQN